MINNKCLVTEQAFNMWLFAVFVVYRMIHEHDKTQLEIDEEMVRSFDKLYPDNFRLFASPELLEGIVNKMQYTGKNSKSSTYRIFSGNYHVLYNVQINL